MTIVELKNIELEYRSKQSVTHALHDISLQVAKGSCVAVVGRSGCGKSSLLKLISGLERPTAGEVLIHNQLVKKPLGIVGKAFQNASLLPWRTTLQNVLLPLEIVASKRQAYRNNPQPFIRKARELLHTVGLAGFEERYPKQLSGGMKQRVSLCRALIHEPELLLLDEPFGALDAFTREELWLVLQNLRQATACTIILITHDLTEAAYLADTVYVMSPRPGRIIHQTTIAFQQPRSFELQFDKVFVEQVAELRGYIGHEATGAHTAVAGHGFAA